MRILQIAIGFEGGIGKLLVDYCTRMKDRIQFEFLIGQYENGQYEKKLVENGFKVHHIRIGASKAEKKRVFNTIVSETVFDAVHIHGSCDYELLKCAKDVNIKTRIVHSHAALESTRYKNKIYVALRNSYHDILNSLYVTDKWACGNEAANSMWGNKAVLQKKVFIMPNAVNTKHFAFSAEWAERIRRELHISKDELVIGTVGRLTYQKNHSYMIDVMRSLKQNHSHFTLMLIGSGELESELKEKAKRYRVYDNILWLGNRDDVPVLLNAMDVFVLTSHFEGLPVVMMEAQANGLRCVVSDAVTRECDFLDGNQYLSLEAGPEKWAVTIAQTANMGRAEKPAKILQEHGYELNNAVDVVFEEYTRAVNRNDK